VASAVALMGRPYVSGATPADYPPGNRPGAGGVRTIDP
jgi:hypothetical protein